MFALTRTGLLCLLAFQQMYNYLWGWRRLRVGLLKLTLGKVGYIVKRRENNVGGETPPTSIKEKETHSEHGQLSFKANQACN